MTTGHTDSIALREINLVQNFMSPSDYLLHLKMEYHVNLTPDVEEMVKLLDFSSSYKKEICICVIDGADFPPRTYLFATRDIGKEMELKNPDPIAICLLFVHLLEDFDSISKFRFVIAPHDKLESKEDAKIAFDQFDLLAISNEGDSAKLIVFTDEPVPGVGFVNKNDGIVFLK